MIIMECTREVYSYHLVKFRFRYSRLMDKKVHYNVVIQTLTVVTWAYKLGVFFYQSCRHMIQILSPTSREHLTTKWRVNMPKSGNLSRVQSMSVFRHQRQRQNAMSDMESISQYLEKYSAPCLAPFIGTMCGVKESTIALYPQSPKQLWPITFQI